MRAKGAVLGLVAMVVVGCGGGAPSAPMTGSGAPGPVGQPGAPATGTPAVLPKEPDAGPPLPAVAYEPKGRRDPFVPIFLGKDNAGLSVSAVKLVGVLAGPRGPLALVEAPDGIGYILKSGDALGDGRVTGITASSVTFAVSARGTRSATSLTLRLPES